MDIGYTSIGKGKETVIICHGWFGDSQVFSKTFSHLNTKRFRYVFIDYRGYGKSKHLEGEYSINEIAQDAIDLADTLKLGQFHLVGHSMGGMVVQLIALKVPERIISIVAVTPVPASGVDFDENGLTLFKGAVESDDNRKIIINFTTGDRLSENWVNQIVSDSRKNSTQKAFEKYFDAWCNTDFSEKARGLETPIKVLIGEFDPALNEEVMRNTFLKYYPNVELEILNNSGHYPMQEIPIWFVSTMEAFLSKNSTLP